MTNDMQPDELRAILRANIRARRKELGLSQAALAERLGVKQPYIAQLEAGSAVPSLDYLAKLAESLKTSPDALLNPAVFAPIQA